MICNAYISNFLTIGYYISSILRSNIISYILNILKLRSIWLINSFWLFILVWHLCRKFGNLARSLNPLHLTAIVRWSQTLWTFEEFLLRSFYENCQHQSLNYIHKIRKIAFFIHAIKCYERNLIYFYRQTINRVKI